jgi:DNA mismatch repair protein MutL
MARIRQLPPEVVTKIAAGEVIERPASVVKELLENAVDAGARRIEVEVEQGGAELIRVADDGCGIQADDLQLAFASHATSKLSDAEDLFRIGTLGFRGEALASVGGVAQVRIQSRPGGHDRGAEVTCHGGELAPVRAWNGAPGTRVEVRHLFYNTPVRRKFLRTSATELGHVCEAFTRLALGRPDLHLTLRHNAKTVYEVPASAGLRDRLGLFFGADVHDRLYEIQATHGPVALAGFVADPACDRGTSKLQYLFVNGRWVRDRSLGHALQEAYRGLLMTGRYAVAALYLTLPPDQVDVNVHPTKAEVRFRDSQALHHLVFGAVRDRLRRANLTPRLRVPTEEASFPVPVPVAPRAVAPIGAGTPDGGDGPTESHDLPPPLGGASAGGDVFGGADGFAAALRSATAPRAIQVHDAYLVLETPDGMLVIDQHALHERILFEQLKRRVQSNQLERQRLLVPEPVDFPAEQAARALEHREALAELGLEVEDFGGGTVLLTGYPAILDRRSPRSVLLAVVDYLVSKERPPGREQLLDALLSRMACHAAVRAGDRLTPEEVNDLIAQRDLADNTHHCPHGRPTSLLFSKQELERQFRRV